ncbi:MAG: helix-turn-helix domain-containing protein [Ruminococcus flavefaciens]|nr:helix-turn-helix domain-containing protein [Ruminococcus flavefaciens]
MSLRQKYDHLKNTFPLPNEIFLLGLCPGELAVYAFLRQCENRKTHQCWPSYKTIGKAVGMSENTVAKHVCSLVDKGLIQTESTSVMTKSGMKRNGNLLYTIPPFQPILEDHYRQQLEKAKWDTARTRWEAQGKTHESPCVAL